MQLIRTLRTLVLESGLQFSFRGWLTGLLHLFSGNSEITVRSVRAAEESGAHRRQPRRHARPTGARAPACRSTCSAVMMLPTLPFL